MASPGGEWQRSAEATSRQKAGFPHLILNVDEKDHPCFRLSLGGVWICRPLGDQPAPFRPRLQLDVARLRVEVRSGLGLAWGTRGFSGCICPSLRCRGVMLSLLGRCPRGPDWGGAGRPDSFEWFRSGRAPVRGL